MPGHLRFMQLTCTRYENAARSVFPDAAIPLGEKTRASVGGSVVAASSEKRNVDSCRKPSEAIRTLDVVRHACNGRPCQSRK